MLNIKKLSNAFLDFAEKQTNNEQIINDLITFNTLFEKNNSVKSLIFSKRITIEDKKKILLSSIDSIINNSVIEFILYLSKDKSIKQLSKIIKLIEEKYKERQGIIDVNVISSVNLDSNFINDISNFIKNKHAKKAVINQIIDKELIAGVKLRIGNTILDGTISNKLKKLKNNLINNSN